ncbi:MAG TPA: polyamine ABC transporter substrate-binding protein [Stellaceae bacterium]|nr:polyamine ABC transporter substrate-binding protein [Stellaceae bacterium]
MTTGARMRIGRRRLMQSTAAAAALGILGAPAVLRAKPSQMVISTGGGGLEDAYKAAYFEPWTAKTGIAITTAPNTGAKLKAMVEQKAVEWDVSQQPAELAAAMAKQGLLEPLDYSIIDRSKLIKGVAFDDFVMCDIAAYHIAWNTKLVKPGMEPKDWHAFWAFNGRRGLWKRPYQTMEVALMADGVDKDKLYPLDIDRALKSLAKIKDGVYWWERGAQVAQILIDGEVETTAAWNGRVYEPKKSGAPVDYHLNQALLVADAWVVPKGAPNKREAMEFIALAVSTDRQAVFSQKLPYGPVNADALKLLPKETLAILPSSEENLKRSAFLDVTWWADNGSKAEDAFNKWITG